MLETSKVAAKDRRRLAEILQVATRFGLETLVGVRRADHPNTLHGGATVDASLPAQTRMALEALGPTFIKLGQICATRTDLFPPEWTQELEKLHSQAPTLPFETLREAVEDALGEPPESAFAHFDPEPLAAASMAQVHRAKLKDGRDVVLKIRRPGIRDVVEADLRLMTQFATLAERTSPQARRYMPSALVGQLAEAMLAELDFTAEGRNADRLRADFIDEPRILIPAIHWEWTSEALLVMDLVEGVPPRDDATLRANGIDPVIIAELGADLVLDMVLINGRFHADPHPGNLLCLPGNRLALLDLGMIGHVSPRQKEEFLRFVQAIDLGDAPALADVLALWSSGSGVPRTRILVLSERLVRDHAGQVVLSALVTDFLPLLREAGLLLPPDLLLIFKAMITIDGMLNAIVPGFDLSAALARARRRIILSRLAPESWEPKIRALAMELSRLGDDAPRLVRAAVRRLETEDAPERAMISQTLIRAANRVAAAILIGAGLIATILAVIR